MANLNERVDEFDFVKRGQIKHLMRLNCMQAHSVKCRHMLIHVLVSVCMSLGFLPHFYAKLFSIFVCIHLLFLFQNCPRCFLS